MSRRSFTRRALTVIAAVLMTCPARASNPRNGLEAFHTSIVGYMGARERAVRHLPLLEISDDAGKIHDGVEARALAIATIRWDARRGDIFNPAVSAMFRARIHATLDRHGLSPLDVLRDIDAPEGHAIVPPFVNGRFSWQTAVATPAVVLKVLPALPDVLQYRFVGVDLALVDVEASLVADVLPDVLAAR